MILTSRSGRYQPYISWKGTSTYAAAPTWSAPPEQNTTNQLAPSFKPNPIRHWRKQLKPNTSSGYSRTATGILDNAPGSTNYLGVSSTNCENNGVIVGIPSTKNNVFQTGSQYNVVGPNGSRVCVACNPENNVIKSGQTEKLINPTNSTVQPQRKYNYDTRSYLRSKCATYEQRLSGSRVPGVQYIIPGTNTPAQPSDSDNGAQVRYASNCSVSCNNEQVKIIYKPNNQQFATQGAVSSSSRIQRLKLNTINKNGSSFASAWGASAANAGRYSSTGNAPFFIKSKNNVCRSSLFHMTGKKNICN